MDNLVPLQPGTSCDLSAGSEQSLFNRISNRIRESLELTEILSATVAEVRAYLGTDRVEIYQFFPDGHGWVIAEALNDQKLPPLKGLHFPKDDIPPYTWEQFINARQRIIVDVSQRSVAKSRLDCIDTGTPLPSYDLNVSPIDPCHLEYLLAMGVQSSVVVPIVLEKPNAKSETTSIPRSPDQLWGLLISHHSQPRTVYATELEFIQSVVDQVSIAISQSVLLKQVREQARREADVNRVTALLYTTTTVQLERALLEAVAIYQGSGGRLSLFNTKDQTQSHLYTCGDQPSTLPGEFNRPVEDHAIWRNFLESTLAQDEETEITKRWSVQWMKETYSHEHSSNKKPEEINVWAIADIYKEPLFRSLTPRFQSTEIRGVMICPLHYGEHLIGCLTIFRNEVNREITWAGCHVPDERQMAPRQSFAAWHQITKGCAQEWTTAEIKLIQSLAERFSIAIKQYQLNQTIQALNTNLERQVEIRTLELNHSTTIANQQRTLANILAKLQKPLEMRTLFRTATQEVLQLLKVDRVAVYRFDEDWGGEFVDEFGAVSPGWEKLILATRSRWNDSHMQETQGGQYSKNEIAVVHDIHNSDLTPCHLKVLEEYYIGAYLIAPLFMGEKLWGLLATYQHDKPRQWAESEIAFIQQLSTHLGVVLQQAESLERVQTQAQTLKVIAEKQTALNNVITKIRNSLDLDTIFKTTTMEMCQLLNADRVAVFQFDPEESGVGQIISEEIRPGFPSALDIPVDDQCFITSCKEKTSRRETFSIDDVRNAQIKSCYRDMLDKFHIRANLAVPIFKGKDLWGLLCIHQCSGPREWTASDKEFAIQIAAQFEVALQQAKLLIEAQKALKTADAANRAKSQFLANMSHELRTPLNAILGLGQLLSRDESLTAQQQERLSIIGQSGEHLLLLINEVLEMSRIEAGMTQLDQKVVHLPAFLKSLEAMLNVTANEKNLKLKLNLAPDLPDYILVDEGKLRQVLINLLGNGLKFTEIGEVVLSVSTQAPLEIVATPEGDLIYEIHFDIKDTGPGIPPEDLQHIFEPFSQGPASSKSQQGNGLGLSICHQFIQLMKGNIFVASEIGVGSNFHFFIQAIQTIPLAEHLPSPKKIKSLAANQKIPKILVVEDIEVNQILLVDFLESLGFIVKTANNGREAIDRWQDWSPDLIWMDMWMPVMDGHEATKEIKQLAGDQAPIIIALTANAFEADRQIAMEHGCDDFIRKPFQTDELLKMMKHYLGVTYDDIDESSTDELTNSNSLSILVAEDNPLNQTTIMEMLTHLKHDVRVVGNGLEAIEALKQQTFDLILMDIHMPHMDGFTATQQIREQFPQPQPIIVGATGSVDAEELERCLQVGMNTTLVKPFLFNKLQSLLSKVPEMIKTQAETAPLESTQACFVESPPETEIILDKSVNEPAILNREYLEDFEHFFGEEAPQKLSRKLHLFLEKMHQQIAVIREAIAINDHQTIFQIAHNLKSTATYVGGTEIASVCEALETNAHEEIIENHEDLEQKLVLESHRLQLALETEISHYSDQINQDSALKLDLEDTGSAELVEHGSVHHPTTI